MQAMPMLAKEAQSGPERRRLLAVLAADIVAYTRLMQEDEDDTFHRLRDLNSTIIGPAATRNHGSIVKWTGNGFIGVFDSAVDAVRTAIEIQSGIAAAGAGPTQDRQMRLRIGISAGDVIAVPGNVFGDTVNLAVRLQALAAPGSICISRSIRDAVRGKFTIEYEDRGELEPKIGTDPVNCFKVVFDPIAWTMNERIAKSSRFPPSYQWAGVATAALIMASIAVWWLVPTNSSTVGRVPTSGSETKAVASAPTESSAIHSIAPSPSDASGASIPSHSTLQTSSAPTMPTPEPSSISDALAARLRIVLPRLGETESNKVGSAYEAASGHKAQAASLQPPGLWRSAKRAAAEDAESSALEDCQIVYGAPCALIATDNAVSPMPPGGNWPLHDMPRVHYSGEFDPAQIPGLEREVRERSDIVDYASAPGPKAAAFHPNGGRFFTITRGASQRAAEEAALRKCNLDPERKGKDGKCFLYAAGNDVVLSRRLTRPLSNK